MKAGAYTLTITHAGYKKIEKTVSVRANATQVLNYILAPTEQMGEVVVLGSRSVILHSNLSTPVPVDVYSSARLEQTGQISLTQMLNFTHPSFITSREILNEPAALRGLDPQHVLILINGVRYHNMAWLFAGGLRGQLGRGSVGNDLNSIPFPSIEKVEILRDGASAQYGSDAIAGVINIQLKETTGKTSIQLHTGQFYKGDGEKLSFGINSGISLNKKGFLNFSASYRYQAPTYRGGEYSGTVYENYPANATPSDSIAIKVRDDSMVKGKNFDRKTVADNIGNLKTISAGLLVNGGYAINNRTEVFLTASLNERKTERGGVYRFPKNPSQVNRALYPDGFQSMSKPNTTDLSVIAGIKGETKRWHWDFSSSYGSNSVKSYIENTNNASQSSMGDDAPTSFYTGKDIYKLFTNDINFSKRYLSMPGKMKSLNIAWGAEWRVENYHTKEGEEASWENYDLTGKTQGGSQGASGWDPKYVVNKNRNVWAAYIDLEAEYGRHFLFNAAGRYEYYSDFGDNIATKLAARYKFSDKLTVRASAGNGFRAPSLQQRYMNAIQTSFVNNGGVLNPVIRGSFPNDHEVIKALGIPLLTAEKTINVSGGFTSSISNHISLIVDAYWIQIKDRIVLSGTLDRSMPAVKKILDSIPGFRVDQVQFFTNAINTRTKGMDIILDGNWNSRKASLNISLAANFTSTHLFGDIKTSDKLPADSLNTNTVFNIEEKIRIEKGQPTDKIILSVNYKRGKTSLMVRNTRFGKTTIGPVFRNPTRILYESFSPKILTDISLAYCLRTWVTLTLGADNVFNVYPDRLRNYENTVQGSWIYSAEASPFGFNGGYFFVNMLFNF
jgi:iron complex outermembrane receptor protein